MPRGKTERRVSFTDRFLKALKPPPRPQQLDYFDSSTPGFGLRISYNGRKSWIIMYRHGGVKRRMTFGRFDLIPLAAAREEARELLKIAASGKDPATRKRELREAETFEQLVDRYIEEYAKAKKVTWRKDERLLKNNLVPALGRILAKIVTKTDLRRELKKIAARPAPVEANRTLEVVRKMYNWAIEEDEEAYQSNPAAKLAKLTDEKPRERTLTADELATFWKGLDDADPIVRGVLRMMILAAQRRNEVTRMRKQDLDLRDGWWNIPAGFTKTKRPYRVPITPMMLEIIKEMDKLDLDPVWVFPRTAGGAPVPETNVTRPFRKLIADLRLSHFTPHDLLHTTTSHMTGMGISEFDVAKIRHHTPGGKKTSTSRYNHYQYDREKRRALDLWNARLQDIIAGKQTSNVVELARA